MNCEQAEEYISALCDGEKIPQFAAEHIGNCQMCQLQLTEYATIGAELRRLASLNDSVPPQEGSWTDIPAKKITWWQKGLTTMKIPRLAFGVMLVAIVALSGGLVLVRARAGSVDSRFLELTYMLAPDKPIRCIMGTDGSQKERDRITTCNFVDHGRAGLLAMNTRLIAKTGDSAQLGIRAMYIPGAGEMQVNYNEALFKDTPEQTLSLEPDEKQELEVAGLGKIEVQGEYLDHIPPLVQLPQERLDPNPGEFRIVDPVLVRDNQVIAKAHDESIHTLPEATLMFYIPGEGRYLISVVPFEGAVEGSIHLGQIAFSLEGHDYLLLTSMPISVAEHVWAKHEPDFKPSKRMVRKVDERDDRQLLLVRPLKQLEEPRIAH